LPQRNTRITRKNKKESFHHEAREGHEVLKKPFWMVLRALHLLRGREIQDPNSQGEDFLGSPLAAALGSLPVSENAIRKAGAKSAIGCLLLQIPTSVD
jgi:hypothetical protein